MLMFFSGSLSNGGLPQGRWWSFLYGASICTFNMCVCVVGVSFKWFAVRSIHALRSFFNLSSFFIFSVMKNLDSWFFLIGLHVCVYVGFYSGRCWDCCICCFHQLLHKSQVSLRSKNCSVGSLSFVVIGRLLYRLK